MYKTRHESKQREHLCLVRTMAYILFSRWGRRFGFTVVGLYYEKSLFTSVPFDPWPSALMTSRVLQHPTRRRHDGSEGPEDSQRAFWISFQWHIGKSHRKRPSNRAKRYALVLDFNVMFSAYLVPKQSLWWKAEAQIELNAAKNEKLMTEYRIQVLIQRCIVRKDIFRLRK